MSKRIFKAYLIDPGVLGIDAMLPSGSIISITKWFRQHSPYREIRELKIGINELLAMATKDGVCKDQLLEWPLPKPLSAINTGCDSRDYYMDLDGEEV